MRFEIYMLFVCIMDLAQSSLKRLCGNDGTTFGWTRTMFM